MNENKTLLIIQLFLGICILGIFIWVKFYNTPVYVPETFETLSGALSSSGEVIEPAKVYTLGGKQYPVLQKCPENFLLNTLRTSLNTPCIPVSAPDILQYKDIKLVWIDATFASDGIDLQRTKEYFESEWAILYGTQSPWVAPDLWVLRINSDYLFADQKVFFIFYNEAGNLKNFERERIISYLTNEFRHLDDIRVHSFETLRADLAGRPQDSEIGRLFYYVWDCQYLVHGWCNAILRETGKFPRFSQAMISDDIDILFVVPSTMQKIKRLEGLFKDVL